MISLPKKRFGTRHGPKLNGFRVYVQVNWIKDPTFSLGNLLGHAMSHVSLSPRAASKRIVEVFVDVDLSEGTHLVEQGHLIGRLVSHALRGGARLDDIIGDLRSTAGGPEGIVEDGPNGVTEANSLADLVGQILQWEQFNG